MRKIILGSRGSDLALWQAHHVQAQLENLGCEVEIKIIKTQGDMIQHLSFDKMEGKGFFTKEIEAALLDKSIDLAVHSHKDLETNPPAGLVIAAVSDREDPADLLLVNTFAVDPDQVWGLKRGATVGTSSARRKSLVIGFRPDAKLTDLRGNVPTRIQKLRDGNYDAILLAKAGVARLEIDLSEFHVVTMDPTQFVPAPAQGVLGLQVREEDSEIIQLLEALDNKTIRAHISIERTVLNRLDGGCQLPLGVYCPNENEAHVAFSNSWSEPAYRKYYSGGNLAELILADLLPRRK